MNLLVGRWFVDLREDDDGHLVVAVSHKDGTRVVCCDADIAVNDAEWSDRFTTEGIEAHLSDW